VIHRTTNEVEIMLPIACFGIKKQYYPMLKDALMAIPTISVQYPKWSHAIKKTLSGIGTLCTYVAIRKDEKDKRRELAHFFFPIEVVSCMVSPQFGFTKLLNRSLDRFDNIYTTKIYMQICRFADKGKWIISYSNLRKLLCVGKKFGRYYDFRNRILKDVENILMNDSNHWFTLAECFRNGDDAPYLLIFNIYSAENERRNLLRFRKLKDNMLGTMLDTLKINKATAFSVVRKINIRNYEYIWRHHNQLLGYMIQNEEDILNNQAYYVKTIEQIIDKEKFSQLAIQQHLF
ncbi:MAG: replication initiation protein, partial [Alistipes sp.]|nr:replication initiation protein [Alistipes sp.]